MELLNKAPQGRQRTLLLISETRNHGSQAANMEKVVSSVGSGNTVIYALAFSPGTYNLLDTMRGNEVHQQIDWTECGHSAGSEEKYGENNCLSD